MITEERKKYYIYLIKNSCSLREVCLKANIIDTTGNYNTLKRIIKEENIDISHFKRQNSSKQECHDIEYYLVKGSKIGSYKLKNKLLKEGLKEQKCECCGLVEWFGQPIKLELHHLNGDNTDNRLENLQLLCPNCHSYTDNYGGKNQKININKKTKSNNRKSIDVNSLQELLNTTNDINVICEIVGRKKRTILKYIKKYNLEYKKNNIQKYNYNVDEMISLMKSYGNYSKVAKILNISGNAVKKRFITLGYPNNINDLKNALK